jgi:hypothetical protein
MLLIDGVRYELWTPEKEVEEFHPIVKEHYKEIFGNNSMYIDGSRLKSEAGKGSVPDGFVVELNEKPRWYIVEIELSAHELYDHIVNQVGRFINGIKNTDTQKKLIEAVYHHIQDNKQRKAEFEEAIGSGEIYKYISDLITKPPVLVIIIEERTRELDEALDLLKYSPINIIEFQTFKRVGAETVHAHLFEPLYKPTTPTFIIGPESITQKVSTQRMEQKVWRSYREYGYIGIWKKFRDLFPDVGETIELVNGDGEIYQVEIGDYEGSKQLWGLQEWYRKHPDVKEGDSIIITVIEPMKKYRLEILKE